MNGHHNLTGEEQKFEFRRSFYLPFSCVAAILVVMGGFGVVESFSMKIPLSGFLGLPPKEAWLLGVFLVDAFMTLTVGSLIRGAWIETSLAISRDGIRKKDFWGRPHLIKWPDIIEVRSAGLLEFRTATDAIGFNTIYFKDPDQLRSVLEQQIPWFNAEGGLMVRRWSHFWQLSRVHARPVDSGV